MSESNEALGLPEIIQWKGKPYFLSPMDHAEVVAAYESHLEGEAWKTIERARAKKWLSSQSYEDQSDGIRRDIVAGVYSYGSRTWLDSIKCLANQKQLLHLMLTHPEGQRDLPLSMVDEMYADPKKLEQILKVAFKGADPNAEERTRPAAASA